jgi:very-short-patch-repair endonuclease
VEDAAMDPRTTTSIAGLMSHQHGHVTRDQLLRAGLSRSTIRRRQHRGELIRVGGRTWRVASAPSTPDGRLLAVCLDLDAVVSHWTAAALHGLVPRRPLVDVTVPRMRSVWMPGEIEPGVRVHTSTHLPIGDIVTVGGVPAMNVARTLMALGALVPGEITQERLAELLAVACERGLASDRWLFWLLERRRGRGRIGTIAFEEALAALVRLGPTESWLERETLRILEEAGLPRPLVQQRVERKGRFVGRVDFRFDGWPVVLESLGYATHRSRADMERDTRRVNGLQLAGLTVLQFSYDQVVRDPASVASDVADALGLVVRRAA